MPVVATEHLCHSAECSFAPDRLTHQPPPRHVSSSRSPAAGLPFISELHLEVRGFRVWTTVTNSPEAPSQLGSLSSDFDLTTCTGCARPSASVPHAQTCPLACAHDVSHAVHTHNAPESPSLTPHCPEAHFLLPKDNPVDTTEFLFPLLPISRH